MKLEQHTVASVLFCGGLWAATHSPAIALPALGIGILMDLDHVLDYQLQHPGSLDVKHFFKICNACELRHTYLWLHSLELLAIAWALTYFLRSAVLLGCSVGMTLHIILDYIGNKTHFATYFLIYRFKQKFKIEKIFILQR